MKISGVGSKGAVSGTKKSEGTGAKGEFRKALIESMDSMEEAHAVEAPVGITGIDALLVVQQVDNSVEREARRRLVRRGEELLDGLEELRHGLLMGEIPTSRMMNLAQNVRMRRENCADPRLAAILDEIELRVEVELAKLSSRG
ncbi:Putative Flagellar assembly regulator FliX(Flagellar assembly regulator FliX, class II,1-141) [Magnetospirillum sp. XM-1]|uniref:flagellar assembly protein FliX n=1 Tax=Magnetospirillum sp. XM-1 TaxID=1663591 RepID=UPI00073DEDD3|nr:flagellar assembly protein FliX [Magnetospirillum sp. XM-1]CUW38605.1 Putative Flagellar assembly regulator FliX(Flagellar assembly regulator FliX, class II,1-141) [Magnetospirillum sp. XM-1]